MKEIYVTARDYQKGIQQHWRLCAVARAIHRRYPKEKVRCLTTYVAIGEKAYWLPEKAQTQIKIFDGQIAGVNVPIRFKLCHLRKA